MTDSAPRLATREDVVNDILSGLEAAHLSVFGALAKDDARAVAILRLASANARPTIRRVIDASITDAHVAAYIRHKSDADMQDFTRKSAQLGELVGAILSEEINKLA